MKGETSASSKFIPGLNGVRAIAVTAVVWHHTHQPISEWPVTGLGFLGVDVFFVLSGFLITTLLLQEREGCGSISLKGFYLRRTLRIFPLYYAVLALVTVYFLLSHSGQRGPFFQEFPSHLLYFSNWVHVVTLFGITWSLSTEEQFYLAWPPLVAWLGNRAVWLLLAFLVLNQAVNFGMLDPWLEARGTPVGSLSILQVTFTPIILGSLLAYAMRSGLRSFLQRIHGGWGGMACVAFLIVADLVSDLRGWPRLTLQLLATAGLASIVARPNSFVVRLLESPPFAHVGAVSYGVYLLHLLVLDGVSRLLKLAHLDPSLWAFPLCLGATVFLASLSFRYFESPITRSKASVEAFLSRRRAKPALAAAGPVEPLP